MKQISSDGFDLVKVIKNENSWSTKKKKKEQNKRQNSEDTPTNQEISFQLAMTEANSATRWYQSQQIY